MEKAVRGTQDILPVISGLWQFIENTAMEVFASAGFEEIRTPIFEHTSLFSRAVGEETDIVNKEMYTFLDKSERSITLRPEGTAGTVRAYIEHSLHRSQKPQKLWYRGPMFRYERPQTGRYRQFHQIGAEAFATKAPYIDIELISLGIQILRKLGLQDLKLYINSIGTIETRKAYREALRTFLRSHLDGLCDDCKRRYDTNPLRVLDCKVPADQAIYQKAPLIYEFFDEESQDIWNSVQKGLIELGLEFTLDPKLVRGLDYYNHVVFEIKTTSPKLSGQSTVLAGGRYDSLVESLGGPPSPAVGWAFGMERLAILLEETHRKTRDGVFIVCEKVELAQKLAKTLREDTGYQTRIEYDFEASRLQKQLEKAEKKNSKWILFYLGEERESRIFKLKQIEDGKDKPANQYEITYDELLKYVS